ncbi:MFS general substrate transporter [Trematosphaeria pertusa]|uniref:MFS general substrate transporter n=1 Tax=Trematosphaeria pertusa TaxID=390896 RepID=A0A6A6IGX9_9PLEO|nr:MFS general substrate transporter [Trematosphaeria pertusa]KAF2249666.1 MFS general substrate transporter [Trematosphaeria pertusa]
MPRPSNLSATTATTDDGSPTSGSRPSVATLLCFSALTLSIFLVALDTVLIPTALPTISLSFHIPDSLYPWTGSAYLLSNAASMPFWGKLSDVFGRKPVILIANSIFLGGSIVCAVSISAPMLVAGRAVQGLGGGGVNVLVYVCVADLFAIRDRSFYMGIVGAMWAVASALGPVLGGVFAQKLNWRWCFYINLPLVSMSIIILYFTLHLHNPRTPFLAGLISIDWPGTVTILTATVLLLVGLQLGGTSSYSTPLVISFLVFGSLAYILFPFTQWWDEKRGGSPIMPLRIFRDISNLSALGVCACDALVFNSVAYFLPLYFQLVLAVSPSTSGLYMLAVAIPLAIVSFATGAIINKTGRYLEVLQAGLALMTLGVGLLISFTTTLGLGKIIGVLIVIGIGFGPNFHAPLIALQTRIRESDMAAGTSAFGFVRMVSGAIGVVVGQVVFQLLMRPHLGSFLDAGLSDSFAEALAAGEAISEASRVAQLSRGQRAVVREGMSAALRGTWIFYTVVSALGLMVSFGIMRKTLEREGAGKRGGEVRSVGDKEAEVESGRTGGEGEK